MTKPYIICYRPIDPTDQILVFANSPEEATTIFNQELAKCGAFLYSYMDSEIIEVREERSGDMAMEYNNPDNTGESSLMTFLRTDRDIQGSERGLPQADIKSTAPLMR